MPTTTHLNGIHDPAHRSWLASANPAHTDFPMQNLPFAVFRPQGSGERIRGGVAIGDQIVDLAPVAAQAVFDGEAGAAAQAASGDTLNALMASGPALGRHCVWRCPGRRALARPARGRWCAVRCHRQMPSTCWLRAWAMTPTSAPWCTTRPTSVASFVTLGALAPFRLPFTRPADDPPPLPDLQSPGNSLRGALDLQLEVLLQSEPMRDQGISAARLSHTSDRHAYWTMAQLVARSGSGPRRLRVPTDHISRALGERANLHSLDKALSDQARGHGPGDGPADLIPTDHS